MSTESTTLRRPPKKQPKPENPAITRAKKALTPQSNIKVKKSTKCDAVEKDLSEYKVIDYYRGYRSSHNKEMSANYREELCEKLILWSTSEDAIEITDFCILNDITECSLENLADRHEIVKEARNIALSTIMARREKGAIYGQIAGKRVDGNSIARFQAQQSKRYREMLTFMNAIKNTDAEKTGSFTLNFYDQDKPKDESGTKNTNTPEQV